MHHYFIVENHEYFGMNGLRMIGRKGAEPFDGQTAAHDVMEHFNLPITADTELLALGGSIFCRDRSHHRVDRYAYGSDIFELINRSMSGEYEELSSCEPSGKCEDLVEKVIAKSIEEFLWEVDANDFNLGDESCVEFFKTNITLWMRKGYRMARRRYGNICPYKTNHIFCVMRDDMNKFLKHADIGEMVCVKFIPKTLEYDYYQIDSWSKKYDKILERD